MTENCSLSLTSLIISSLTIPAKMLIISFWIWLLVYLAFLAWSSNLVLTDWSCLLTSSKISRKLPLFSESEDSLWPRWALIVCYLFPIFCFHQYYHWCVVVLPSFIFFPCKHCIDMVLRFSMTTKSTIPKCCFFPIRVTIHWRKNTLGDIR